MIRNFNSEHEKHRYYNSLSEEQKYDAFCDILFESEHVVFLGGAGVSTESGIPDFRSRNGLYKKKAKAFGRYPYLRITSNTRDLVTSLIFFLPFRTFETVAIETLHSSAICLRVIIKIS
jgi:NAD-dependent deacetylase